MKRALIVGCATCVWTEVESARKLGHYDEIYCVKLVGVDWPDDEHFWWVTLHPDWMPEYIEMRHTLGHGDNFDIIAPMPDEVPPSPQATAVKRRTSFMWEGVPKLSGSSGLFAIKAAFEDGCDKIVLAGVPMTPTGHFRRPERGVWQAATAYQVAWTGVMDRLQGKVKSYSGWTAEKLGIPTQEWFDGETGTDQATPTGDSSAAS